MSLEGKICIITGGTQGIGLEIVQHFVQQGAIVATCGRNACDVESVKKITPHSFICDVSQPYTVREFVRHIHDSFGRIDILVNNAAIYIRQSVAETSVEDWQKVVNINLNGTFYTCKYVVPVMMEQNYGRIVNFCSYVMKYCPPLRTAYVATKLAVAGFTKCLAREVVDYNIKVNNFCPGRVKTRMDCDKKAIDAPSVILPFINKLVTLPDDGDSGKFFRRDIEDIITLE